MLIYHMDRFVVGFGEPVAEYAHFFMFLLETSDTTPKSFYKN